ncbi:MAG: 3-octaprenyl-4-hydroxybenzoate carboxy-lyase, partial [Candidatus Omnitrophica bacterium CG12_big_fil_rev_8_21_14_0_65_45_16]
EKRRALSAELPDSLKLPDGFGDPQLVLPGVLAVKAPGFQTYETARKHLQLLGAALAEHKNLEPYPLIILTEDSRFCAASLNNFLWVTFTRVNPSHDIEGVGAFQEFKHWGCRGSLILDARLKTHHAPPLIEDSKVLEQIKRLGRAGKALHGYL